MSETYREAWGLFHIEHPSCISDPSSSSSSSIGPSPLSPTWSNEEAQYNQGQKIGGNVSRDTSSTGLSYGGQQRFGSPMSNREGNAAYKELQILRHGLNQVRESCPDGTSPNAVKIAQLRDQVDALTATIHPDRVPSAFPSFSRSSSFNALENNSAVRNESRQGTFGNEKKALPKGRQEQNQSLRCWDPCCKGRKFSNNSNLVRHQRERRGLAAKLRCSFCDALFSRSSARNAHEAERRCEPTASAVAARRGDEN